MKKLHTVLVLLIALGLTNFSFAQEALKMQTITIEEFEAKLNQAASNAQILDARLPEEYKLNHLKGAININATKGQDVQNQINQLKLDKKKPVFIYSIKNGRSGTLATSLKEQGFSEVYELPGGFSHWIGSGRPVVSTTGSGLAFDDYNKQIQSNELVLVDVSSKYCGSCKKMFPVVDSVADESNGKVKLIKIEFFENKQLSIDLKVEVLPTFILYKNGVAVWQRSGVFSKITFEEEISKAELSSNKQASTVSKQ